MIIKPVPHKLIVGTAVVTVFLSSFLLFVMQPLVSKHLLPWFGGSAQVWVTVSVFFMVCLLVGYSYVVAVTRLNPIRQLQIHGGLIVAVVAWLLYTWYRGGGITHPLTGVSHETPVLSLLLVLVTLCAIPAVVTATTSSLIQVWCGAVTNRNPYTLYVVSNAGSLLGLLSYPLLIEPYFSVSTQGVLWTVGYILFAVGLLGVITLVYGALRTATVTTSASTNSTYTIKELFRWGMLAGVPVVTMLMVTTYITTFLLPVPFVWVVPLAIYLISFMVSFRDHTVTVPWSWYVLLTLLLATFLLSVSVVTFSPGAQILLTLGIMVLVFHICHELLYGSRPVVSNAPVFYALISVGGVAAGVVALLIPVLFPRYAIEMYLVAMGGSIVLWYILLWRLPPLRWWQKTLRFVTVLLSVMVVAMVTVLLVRHFAYQTYETSIRNFYGHKYVTVKNEDNRVVKTMTHGRTVHGREVVGMVKPTAYYVASSGVGRTLQYLKAERSPVAVAVVGLGVGTLAAYCEPGDTFDFYEIDPQVATIARSDFQFLEHCDGANVIIGDARQTLTKSTAQYDMIIIDAYADDSVPAHLLTIEAMQLYRDRLTPDGIIAIHSSSRYLDLQPVFRGYTTALPLIGLRYLDEKPLPDGIASDWSVFFPIESERWGAPVFADFTGITATHTVVWTDSYNALWPIVRW
jgi:hypothetical protein